jgi:hypothetical protein
VVIGHRRELTQAGGFDGHAVHVLNTRCASVFTPGRPVTGSGGPDAAAPRPAGWFRRRGRADELAAARVELAALRVELAAAHDRAVRAEQELAAVRATATEESPGNDFGQRAEQILRLAKSEAQETRTSAARQASALLERTQGEANAHRRRVADELAERSDELGRKAAEREAALDVRERQIADAAEAERRELDHLRAAAVADADRMHRAALTVAEDIRRRVTAEAASQLQRIRTAPGIAHPGEPQVLRTPAVGPDDQESFGPQG